MRARSHYTGTRLLGSCHYLPQHVVVTRSNVLVCSTQEPPDKILSGSYYVRQIPQLAGDTEHLLRCRSAPAARPVIYQYHLYPLCFFFVTEIWSVCELLTKPKNSKVVFQFERFLALGWVSRPAFPAQKVVRNPMRARPTRLKLIFSSSDCWALMMSWSSTCTTVWKRLDSFSPLLARIFASGGTGVGSPTSQRSPISTCSIIFTPSGNTCTLLRSVLQWECSAAEAITPELPGEPVHPYVSLKSMTTRSPTV